MNFRILIPATFILAGCISPLLVFADTWKGAPNVPPPQGNTAGVIWNTFGTGQVQPNSELNISGEIKATTVSTTAEVVPNSVFSHMLGNLVLQPNKAFHVDQDGPATYYMGNWGGDSGSAKPLTMNVNGDFTVNSVFPGVGNGLEGRVRSKVVQAGKFCFSPGADADCITSWPTGGGLYVNKTGDSMTGPLSLTVGPAFTAVMADGGTIGGRFAGTTTGVQGFSNGAAGYGGAFTGGVRGVQAQGTTYGLFAQTANVGSGTAVYGFNGATGGDFDGLSYGVKGNGGTAGGYFTDKTNTTYTQLATPSYGLFTNNTIYTSGSIHAPNTVLGACVWTGYINDGLAPICPASNPFMNGMQRTGTATRLYCCKL